MCGRSKLGAWHIVEAEFTLALESGGFRGIQITETHRVHEYAASAIVRARKPSA